VAQYGCGVGDCCDGCGAVLVAASPPAAGEAAENLGGAQLLPDVAAPAAGAGGVPRLYLQQGDPCSLRLIPEGVAEQAVAPL